MAFPDYMSLTERHIVDKIIKTALDRGWFISIKDEEEWAVKRSNDYDKITENVAATDMTHLVFRDPEKKYLGMIMLVHGNHEDVIGDCSDNPAMLELCDLAVPA